jgi:hypothetical protein
MYMDAPKNKPTWDNLDLLCDLEYKRSSFNVGNNAHINQICLEVGCFYLWVPWHSEIDRGWVISALCQSVL